MAVPGKEVYGDIRRRAVLLETHYLSLTATDITTCLIYILQLYALLHVYVQFQSDLKKIGTAEVSLSPKVPQIRVGKTGTSGAEEERRNRKNRKRQKNNKVK